MSIASKLQTLASNISSIREAISSKGITVPKNAGTSNFSSLISSITGIDGATIKQQATINSTSRTINPNTQSRLTIYIDPKITIPSGNPQILAVFYYITSRSYTQSSSASAPGWYSASAMVPQAYDGSTIVDVVRTSEYTITEQTQSSTTIQLPRRTQSYLAKNDSSTVTYKAYLKSAVTALVFYK